MKTKPQKQVSADVKKAAEKALEDKKKAVQFGEIIQK
jgi:hypothetical protein